MSFFGKIQEFLDFEKEMPKILVIHSPLLLGGRDAVESRVEVGHEEDVVHLGFTAQNIFPNTMMKNIRVFLLFDFTGSSITVSKVGDQEPRFNVSIRPSPLTFEIDKLGPLDEKQLEIVIHAPAGANAPPTGNYQIGVTGTFDASPVIDLSEVGPKPPALVGGSLDFVVLAD